MQATALFNRSNYFYLGARDTLSLVISAAPFAVVYGALATSLDLSFWFVMSMSVFVFAGASQFIAITLMLSATAFPVIILTVFIVNLRHMLYAASLMPQFSKIPQRLRFPMAFILTDETYAVANRFLLQKRNENNFIVYYLGSGLFMYTSWVFFSSLGIILGQQVPDITQWGLDVAMIVAFIGIIVPILKNYAQWACAITASISALFTFDWPHQTGLMFSSFLAIFVGVLLSYKQQEVTQRV